MDSGIGQAQHLAHSQGSQRVVDAELAGHVHPDIHIVSAGDMERHAQKIVGAQQLTALGAVVGLFTAAIGHQLAGVAFQQGFGVLVIDVHHAHITPPEELPLPAAVLLKGLVLTGTDVVGERLVNTPIS